jgi:hypothetical protein
MYSPRSIVALARIGRMGGDSEWIPEEPWQSRRSGATIDDYLEETILDR